MDCTSACLVEGGLVILSIQAGWTGVVANSKYGNSCPCPVHDNQITFASGVRRTYVFFASTYGGNALQTGYFYWNGSSNSALTVFEQGGASTIWMPFGSVAIAPAPFDYSLSNPTSTSK